MSRYQCIRGYSRLVPSSYFLGKLRADFEQLMVGPMENAEAGTILSFAVYTTCGMSSIKDIYDGDPRDSLHKVYKF